MSPHSLRGYLLIICAACNGVAQADDLGRLFTSATERARIDALRAGMKPQQQASPSTAPARVVVNGTLRGSDGKRLVWLNGAPVNPGNTNAMNLLGDGRVELSWREGTRTLKAGQGIDQSSGEVFDYQTPVPIPTAPTVTAPASTPEATPATPVEGAEKAATDSEPDTLSESKAKPS